MCLVEDFISDCLTRGLTKHTVETYASQVKSFLRAHNDPITADIDDLKAFLGLLRERDLNGSTLKGYFAAISAFYDYLIFEKIVDLNPIPPFRKRYLSRIKEQYNGENSRQLITVREMYLLVKAAAMLGPEEKAIIVVLAKTGIRKGELLGLKEEDLIFKNKVIILPPKAKRTNRIAFMDDELCEVLEEYLSWRRPREKTSWLWISKRGGRIHKDLPNKIIASLAAPLYLHTPEGPLCKKLTCHCFRHFFTTHLHRAGMKDQYIKWIRGDSMSKEAWQGYNHIDPEKVRCEYLRCIPKILVPDSVPLVPEIAPDIPDLSGQKTLINFSRAP